MLRSGLEVKASTKLVTQNTSQLAVKIKHLKQILKTQKILSSISKQMFCKTGRAALKMNEEYYLYVVKSEISYTVFCIWNTILGENEHMS